jgi:hypothetical protein
MTNFTCCIADGLHGDAAITKQRHIRRHEACSSGSQGSLLPWISLVRFFRIGTPTDFDQNSIPVMHTVECSLDMLSGPRDAHLSSRHPLDHVVHAMSMVDTA